jgi:three-Cys-motif partner protein
MDRLNTLSNLTPSSGELFKEIVRRVPKASEAIYSKGAWTAIKLSIIAYYLDLYTIIAREHFDTICYVDTFAGSGLVRITEYDRILYGSPLLGILTPRRNKKFDKFYFVELDRNRIQLLSESVNILAREGYVERDKVQIIPRDMNRINYKELLGKCSHSFFVLDPECTEPHWKTVESILKLPADFSLNFMTAGIRRIWGTLRKDPQRANAMNLFYGGKDWIKARNELDLLNMYVRKVENLGRIPVNIEVKGPGMFHYHIIFAVRPTSGGNPWLDAVYRLKERVEKTDYGTFRRLLNVFYGKTKPLI